MNLTKVEVYNRWIKIWKRAIILAAAIILNPAIQLVCKCADTIFYYRQIFFSYHLLIFFFALQIDHAPPLTSGRNLVDLLGWFVRNLLISKTASRKKNSITNMSYSMNSGKFLELCFTWKFLKYCNRDLSWHPTRTVKIWVKIIIFILSKMFKLILIFTIMLFLVTNYGRSIKISKKSINSRWAYALRISFVS